ncbi:MAG: magnesium transporter [Acidobacteria bacterium]|nr:magnesium transporter [Acidobacteriota bacterium]
MKQTVDALLASVVGKSPDAIAKHLVTRSDAEIAGVLSELNPAIAIEVLEAYPNERRERIAAETPLGRGQQWLLDRQYPAGSVGRLMERPVAVFRPETPVAEVVEDLRDVVKRELVTYIFATEEDGRLVGVAAFRDLLYAAAGTTLGEVSIRSPFALRPEEKVLEAMREVVARHYPAYPVCDAEGRLVGLVRGQILFEQEAYEISAQAGAMVGVEKEERLATPWPRSLKFRHPWLQLNLLTAFVAAAVVGYFQDTIDRIVVLAVFLPVLAGQSGNTGCQALAVTLRGMTLGELKDLGARRLVSKEALLGLLNGVLVGTVAGIGMFVVASLQKNPDALKLGLIVVAAMAASCVVSGIAGALIPLGLKRVGADPATASSIFLTTMTDVASMGFFLGLASLLIR